MHLFDELYRRLCAANAWEERLLLKRNEFLVQPGQTDTRLFYVQTGSLRVYMADGDAEHTLRFGYQKSLLSALDSHISERPTELYIQALKRSSLQAISKKSFTEWLYSQEENLQLWHQLLNMFVYQQMERERDLLTSSPELRYQRVLARSPQLFQEVPQKYIANYLRMTAETLSRLKKS